ncbi:MAG: DUF1428 domain-containing protein [Gammaproteobacteria bacterium]|nr:DUF1428 domain-containing protein [Gammaproteobacteria bacterium]
MSYVDGYVIAVPNTEKAAYIKLAEEAAIVFKEYGAISVVENWGDDVPEGKITSFPMAVKCAENETVVFSWITWPSKEVRDSGMKKAMEDPRMQCIGPDAVPFDGKRMIFGGFETIVDQ